jgi:nuclear pore complex protein Nup205
MAQASDDPIRRRHGIQTLKSTGERTMDIICDDAYGASGSCQISALLLLDALGRLAKTDNSTYIIDSLMRTNFIQVLVESIEKIPQELRETHGKGKRSVEAAVRLR